MNNCLNCLHCKIKTINIRMGHYKFVNHRDGYLYCKKGCWIKDKAANYRKRVYRLNESEIFSVCNGEDIQIKKRDMFKKAERCFLFESMGGCDD